MMWKQQCGNQFVLNLVVWMLRKKRETETTEFFLTALIKSVDLMMIDWENSKEIILMMLFLLVNSHDPAKHAMQ